MFLHVSFALSYKIKISSRGVTKVVEELDKVLALNNLLISLKNHPDSDRFAPGVGPVSLLGKDPYGDLTCTNEKDLSQVLV